MRKPRQEIEVASESIDRIAASIEAHLSKTTIKSKWEWINRPIVIWALSSIVLASFGFLYDWYQDQKKLNNELKSLETEIMYKVTAIQYGLNSTSLDVNDFISGIEYPANAKTPFFVRPEYKEYGLTALLITYKGKLSAVQFNDVWDQQKSINQAIFIWKEELGEMHRALRGSDVEKEKFVGRLQKVGERLGAFLNFKTDVVPRYDAPNKPIQPTANASAD